MGSAAEKGLEEALEGQLRVAEVQQHYNRRCLSGKKAIKQGDTYIVQNRGTEN